MEELTVEQKAKAYDKALERAKAMIKVAANQDEAIGFANTIFPELKESEDEKIRKGIIRNLEYLANRAEGFVKDELKERITWLEKQGEQNKNYKTMIVKFICKKDWHGIGNYYYGKKYNGYPCEKEQKGYDIYDDNHVPTFCDEDFIDEYFNIVTEEKQGEQKPVFEIKTPEESLGIDSATYNEIVDKCIYGEQKPADKIEPKFHEGEWIVWKDKCYKVNYNGCGYELVDQDGLSTSLEYGTIDENAHIWDITKDAKDGDVLAYKYNNIGIFQECEGICWHSYIYLGCDGELRGFNNIGGSHEQTDAHPATQEQRDLLFSKMKESDYKWDADKKEAKKIEQKPTDEDMKKALRTEYEKGRADAIAEMQNPAWSEEDESYLNTTIAYLKDAKEFKKSAENCINWLKSLKDRVQPRRRHTIFDEII